VQLPKRLNSGATFLLLATVLLAGFRMSATAPLEAVEISEGQSSESVFSLAPLFTEHAVLQQGVVLPVWGTAPAGELVTIRFSGQTITDFANSDGRWETHLAPLEGSSESRPLIVETAAGEFVLNNVVVGEVWLCSGQSNMEWPLKHDSQAEALVAESDLPMIRQFKVKHSSLDEPSNETEGTWVLCAPDTAENFTAVGYHFARQVQPKLGVPVGIINASWGGTKIEPWMSREALKKFPEVATKWNQVLEELPVKQVEYERALADYKQEAAEAKANGTEFNWRKYPKPPPGPGTKHAPTGLFNGMIAPLTPYPIAGILWYQGESNCGNSYAYSRMFPALIQDWRSQWNTEKMPFYFVQLPNYEWTYDRTGTKWAEFRAAQMSALALPNVGAAIVIDGTTPEDGHPSDKGYVGARLARLAEVGHYHIASGDASGPLCRSAILKNGEVVVHFKEATSGLIISGNELTGFELASSQGDFHPAVAWIEADSVRVSSEKVPVPVSVRYAWSNNPKATLYNGDGLPASPFVIPVEQSHSTGR